MTRWLWLSFAFLTACASMSVEKSLESVSAGMDKAQVLEKAGNPKRTFRENSQDHWIYIFFRGGEEMSRMVVFDEGRVVRVTKARGKTNWDKEVEAARKTSNDGFKSIDGGGG